VWLWVRVGITTPIPWSSPIPNALVVGRNNGVFVVSDTKTQDIIAAITGAIDSVVSERAARWTCGRGPHIMTTPVDKSPAEVIVQRPLFNFGRRRMPTAVNRSCRNAVAAWAWTVSAIDW
jgi:hypothetical protein